MIISLISAMAHDRVIGIDNRLPWRLPADMRWFRQHTLGKPVVMGRKTFESLGRALPGRHNIVVTRDGGYQAEGASIVHTVDEALAAAGEVDEVMVIGGENLYTQMLPRTDRLYLTLIDADIRGDAHFPAFGHYGWRELERHDFPADADNPYPYSFVVYERVGK